MSSLALMRNFFFQHLHRVKEHNITMIKAINNHLVEMRKIEVIAC